MSLPGTGQWARMWEARESGEARYSIWLEDERSIEEKMKLIQKYDLAGAAQWRLGFERALVWPIIDQYLQ